MTPLKVKICGMKERENILEVGSGHTDFMGFIFYRKSPRYVGDDFVLPEELPDSVGRVGVFVDESVETILRLSKKHKLTISQLHGNESTEMCKTLRAAGLHVIKVFGVGHDFDFSTIESYVSVVDYFLFDTQTDKYGGSGKTFDWSIIEEYPYDVPFFLSGGLNTENIRSLENHHPRLYALDFNSGLEIEPGIKDIEKVNEVRDRVNQLI